MNKQELREFRARNRKNVPATGRTRNAVRYYPMPKGGVFTVLKLWMVIALLPAIGIALLFCIAFPVWFGIPFVLIVSGSVIGWYRRRRGA